jgi:hypothetical protein
MIALFSLPVIGFIGLASQAWAQTYSNCDPLRQECSPNKALGAVVSIDFTDGYSEHFVAVSKANRVEYTSDGVHFTIAQSGDNPTIQSDFYIMFGRVEVILKASPGQGIVSSFVLQSDDLDEIDLEWIGNDSLQFQSNFFSQGNTETYDRGEFHNVHDPQTTFHNYTIDWTESRITWIVDQQVVRILESNTPSGYPQTPMLIRIGSWAGGDSVNNPGTIEWAGGTTDYSTGPFVFTVKSLFVQDYSSGTEYQYGDHTGTWTSIQAIGGEIRSERGLDTPPQADRAIAESKVEAAGVPPTSLLESPIATIDSHTTSEQPNSEPVMLEMPVAQPKSGDPTESKEADVVTATPQMGTTGSPQDMVHVGGLSHSATAVVNRKFKHFDELDSTNAGMKNAQILPISENIGNARKLSLSLYIPVLIVIGLALV